MDLNENIKIAAKIQAEEDISNHFKEANHTYRMGYYQGVVHGFEDGALSQQAKEYWFAEFKREEVSELTPQEKIGFVHHDSRIGIIGHGPSLGCEIQARQYGKTKLLRETIEDAKERGIQIVVVGGDDLPEALKGLSQVHEFTRRPEIIMPAPNFQDEDFKLNSCTSEYFPPQEPKAWDRKTLPNKMNNYKSKKRNRR